MRAAASSPKIHDFELGPFVVMAVIVVVHQLPWHVWEQLLRGWGRGAGPFDAAALARRLAQIVEAQQCRIPCHLQPLSKRGEDQLAHLTPIPAAAERRDLGNLACRLQQRSEEHTSELQSRLHLVCRLLLEKKKRQTITSSTMRRSSTSTPQP